MKVDKKYLYFLVATVVLYTVYELQKPKEVNWAETFHFRDKIPFGTNVTHDLLKDINQDREAKHVFRSLYELLELGDAEDNLLMLSSISAIDKQGTRVLLDHVNKGHTVLIGAENFAGALKDSLEFGMAFNEQLLSTNVSDVQSALAGESVTNIHFVEDDFPKERFEFPSVVASTFFTNFDKERFDVLAENDDGRAVLIRLKSDKGNLYLTSMPLALTNYFVLDQKTSAFAEVLLSLFPEQESLAHNEYYQMGRMESSSIIRFLLRHSALRWAYFLLIGTLVLFVLFEIKRRQRMIPVITPLRNTTMEFVSTLGQLYYRQSDHANLAKKRVLYWLDFVRNHYNLKAQHLDDQFTLDLAKKSGKDKRWIALLVKTAAKVQQGHQLSESELMAFENQLNKFYGIEKSE